MPLVPPLALPLARASGQNPAAALRAESRPIALKDLPEGVRAVALGTGSSSLFPSNGLLASRYSYYYFAPEGPGAGEAPAARALRTGRDALWVDPDEFAALLDGKCPRLRAYRLDPDLLLAFQRGRSPALPPPVFRATWIEAGRIGSWTPLPGLSKPDLLRAFAAPTTNEGAQIAALSAMRQIAAGTILYASDSEDRFPKAPLTAEAKRLLNPYLGDMELLSPSPVAGRVVINLALAGGSLEDVAHPSLTPLLWEERPWRDGRRAVAFADASVRRVHGKWNPPKGVEIA